MIDKEKFKKMGQLGKTSEIILREHKIHLATKTVNNLSKGRNQKTQEKWCQLGEWG
jgi:hypothetical protein